MSDSIKVGTHLYSLFTHCTIARGAYSPILGIFLRVYLTAACSGLGLHCSTELFDPTLPFRWFQAHGTKFVMETACVSAFSLWDNEGLLESECILYPFSDGDLRGAIRTTRPNTAFPCTVCSPTVHLSLWPRYHPLALHHSTRTRIITNVDHITTVAPSHHAHLRLACRLREFSLLRIYPYKRRVTSSAQRRGGTGGFWA
jgi:hypothetical protein